VHSDAGLHKKPLRQPLSYPLNYTKIDHNKTSILFSGSVPREEVVPHPVPGIAAGEEVDPGKLLTIHFKNEPVAQLGLFVD
jgi:hypothetical protein